MEVVAWTIAVVILTSLLILTLMGCCSSKSVLLAERMEQLRGFDDLIALDPKSDVDEAVGVITKAFCGTATQEGACDMQWALGPTFGLEHPQRQDICRYYMKLCVLKYIKDGAVLIGRRDQGELKAVVVFTRWHKYRKSPCEILDWIAIAASLEKEKPAIMKEHKGTPDVQKALDQIGAVEDEWRKKHGSGPHYQIQDAAVDPAAQGQGHSSKLLRRVNELADAENLPCYLFTTSVPGTSSKQVAIYSRFGYEKVEERTIADATGTRGSVTCYAMVRKARSPTA